MAAATDLPQVLPASALAGDTEASTDASSEVYDVVVVGFGMAGGCAALEAARTGARVLVLERAGAHGGTSAMAGGHFYLGGGTAVQRATGQEDSPGAMFDYLMAITPEPDEEKIRAYADGSAGHLDWLEGLGFRFERSFYPEKAVIQPGTEGLMYTGNEKVWPYREQARPAPRGHKVPRPGDTGGASMVCDLLAERLAETDAEVRFETGVTNLVTDDDGAVVGVAWKRFEETGLVRARSVVLAAGGFVMNREMVREHVPDLASKKIYTLGSTYDDGLGLRLGRSVGGAWEHMDEAFATAPFYPPASLVTGILVNRDGQRFVAEDSYHSRTSHAVLRQPGAEAYLIVDSAHIEHPEMPLCPFIDGWETVEEMEQALDIPAGNLAATLEAYNEHAARGEDPELHKHPDFLAPQDTGPWGAYDLTLGKALYAGFTLGGLAVDAEGRVRRDDGSLVPGLFAAGACAANIAQDAAGYASGTQLGEGSFFGRRAGRAAARA